jgi:multidrug efflux pump subunit AcrA (membrane-fusion protein)
MLRPVACRLLLGALTATFLVAGCEVPSQPAAVPTRAFVAPPTPTLSADQVYTVARGRIQDVITARGRVASAQEVTLAFNARGFVKTMNMREGGPVDKDAVLAEMDTEGAEVATLQDEIANNDYDYQLKSVDIQIAKTEPIEMDILNAKAAVKQADVKVQQAQAAYD